MLGARDSRWICGVDLQWTDQDVVLLKVESEVERKIEGYKRKLRRTWNLRRGSLFHDRPFSYHLSMRYLGCRMRRDRCDKMMLPP